MEDGTFIIIAILAAAAVAAVLIFRRAELSSKIEPKATTPETSLPAEGDTAVVSKTLRPIGVIEISGKPYEATSEGEFIEPGAEVAVIGRLGGRALVRRAKGQ